MEKVINILKYIIIIILIIAVIGIVGLHIISSTIMNKEYVIQKLEESNYYEQIYNQIESNFENYIYQSGLDESVIKDICTLEKVEKDTNIIISNIYDGTKEKVDPTEITDKLEENIEESLKNVRLTSSAQEAIDEFVEKISEEYTNTITHTDYEEKINTYYEKIQNVIEKVQRIAIVVAIVLGIILIISNTKEISKDIEHCGIILLSSGLFYVFCNIIINSKVDVQNIKILNDAFSQALTNIIADILATVANYGYIFAIVGLIAIIVGNTIRRKLWKN